MEMDPPAPSGFLAKCFAEILMERKCSITLNDDLVHPARLIEGGKHCCRIESLGAVHGFEVDLDGIADLDLSNEEPEVSKAFLDRLEVFEHHGGMAEVDAGPEVALDKFILSLPKQLLLEAGSQFVHRSKYAARLGLDVDVYAAAGFRFQFGKGLDELKQVPACGIKTSGIHCRCPSKWEG